MTSTQYVVIGGVAAGMSAASRIRKHDPGASVVVLEKGAYISYSACSMPYYIANPEARLEDLIVLSADEARHKRKIDVRLGHEATRIDTAERLVHFVQHPSGREGSVRYDRLIIATGASAFVPSVEGAEGPNVYTLRSLRDGQAIREAIDTGEVRRAVILGAGYVGMEMCEALVARGVATTLISARSAPMMGYHTELVRTMMAELETHGVRFMGDQQVKTINSRGVQLTDSFVEADMVIVAKGIRPNVSLADDAGIRLGEKGAIAVDQRMETSLAGVFAAGDCAESVHRVTNRRVYVPLGTVANKHGRVAGLNAARVGTRFPGVISSAELKCFDLEIARTGMTPDEAEQEGFDPVEVHITASSAAHGYPERHPIQVAMVADRGTGRLLGAQMVGKAGVAHRINIVAAAVFNGNTIDEFAMFDLAYAPPFSPVWDPVLVAANVLQGKLRR